MLQLNDGISGFWNYAAPVGGVTGTGVNVMKAAVVGRANLLSTLEYTPTDTGADVELLILRAATVIWRGYVHSHAASQVDTVVITFDPPLSTADNEALNYQMGATGCTIYLNARGYEGQRTHT